MKKLLNDHIERLVEDHEYMVSRATKIASFYDKLNPIFTELEKYGSVSKHFDIVSDLYVTCVLPNNENLSYLVDYVVLSTDFGFSKDLEVKRDHGSATVRLTEENFAKICFLFVLKNDSCKRIITEYLRVPQYKIVC